MDTRKVQKVSAGTYVISLPKQWAVRHDVRAGTLLSIDESASGGLIIKPHGERAAARAPHIKDDEVLEESLIACYIMGAESIVITDIGPTTRARTLSALQELPGLDVAEEGERTIAIRCIIDEHTVKFSGMLDRMCALLRYGAELTHDKPALLQNEQEINRTYHLCERILAKASHDPLFLEQSGIASARIIPALQLLVKRLEHVGDAMKEMPPLDVKQQKWLISLVDMLCGMVRMLTADKLAHAKFPSRQQILSLGKGQRMPQMLFLIRTLQDVKEELILIRTGLALG